MQQNNFNNQGGSLEVGEEETSRIATVLAAWAGRWADSRTATSRVLWVVWAWVDMEHLVLWEDSALLLWAE